MIKDASIYRITYAYARALVIGAPDDPHAADVYALFADVLPRRTRDLLALARWGRKANAESACTEVRGWGWVTDVRGEWQETRTHETVA